MIEHRFVAMGCEVIVGGGTTADHAAIERLFAEREVVFSRFVPQSELNRVNASAGTLDRGLPALRRDPADRAGCRR